MSEQLCPGCGIAVTPNHRYPRYFCSSCAALAASEDGRPLSFSNFSLSGGFVAQYADTGERRDSHICIVKGIRSWADEARFGGIVIQPVNGAQS